MAARIDAPVMIGPNKDKVVAPWQVTVVVTIGPQYQEARVVNLVLTNYGKDVDHVIPPL